MLAVVAMMPTAVLADSPLMGKWVLNGGEPKPRFNQVMTFLSFDFSRVMTKIRVLREAPMELAFASPKEQREWLSPKAVEVEYVDRGNRFELLSGSDMISYKYEIRSANGYSLLFVKMPPNMGGTTKIYRRPE